MSFTRFIPTLAVALMASFPDEVSALNLAKWRTELLEAGEAMNVTLNGNETDNGTTKEEEEVSNIIRAVYVDQGRGNDFSFDRDENGTLIPLPGSTVENWNNIQTYTGLELQLSVASVDWGASYNLENTSVGFLARGEADVSMNVLAHCCGRYTVHDFTGVVETRTFTVIFQPPDLVVDIFSSQFEGCVWIAMLSVTVALMVTMLILQFIANRGWRKKKGKEDSDGFGAAESLDWVFGLVSQQGCEKSPAGPASRILFVFGFFFGLLCFASFSANIVTTLTSAKSLNTIEELIAYTPIKIFGSSFPPWKKEIEDSKNPTTQKLWQRMVGDVDAWPCKGSVNFVCETQLIMNITAEKQEGMAYASTTLSALNRMEHLHESESARAARICSAQSFELPMGEQLVMYGMRRGLPQKDLINKAIIRMRETGILYRTNTFPVPQCGGLNSVGYKEVSTNHVVGAYYLLLCGYGLAIFIFAVEKVQLFPPKGKRRARVARQICRRHSFNR